MALLISILKTTTSTEKLTFKKLKIGDNEIDKISIDSNNIKYTKKSRKSKTQKLSKSQKLSKLRKKSLKSGNSINFGIKKIGPSFLIPNARKIFNYLWLAFTNASIFWYFDLKCYI